MSKIKYFIGGTLALFLLGAGCIIQPEDIGTLEDINFGNQNGYTPPHEEEQEIMGMEDGSMNMDESMSDKMMEIIERPVKVFDITARQWEFEPSTIVVKKGDEVKLNISSVDVTHGFSLPEFDINNVHLVPDTTSFITFTADKTGSFTFSCSVFCGSGHSNMDGILIVQE